MIYLQQPNNQIQKIQTMANISRRSFLQKVATVAMASAVAPVAALAADETAKTKAVPGTGGFDADGRPLPPKKIIGRGSEMKIIQITDTHLRGDNLLSFGKCDTSTTVRKAVEYFQKMQEKDLPDMFIATGDLADNGNHTAYGKIHDYFSDLPRPVFCVPGNHDNRADMLRLLGDKMCPVKDDIAPYICYTVEGYPVRIICIDTIVQGKHWGGITEKVADWLEAKLDEQPRKKTLIFTHHPPFDTGMGFMDEGFENIGRLEDILTRHKNHIQLCCGHMHRNIATRWRGVPVTVSAPICMLMEIDFTEAGGDRFWLADPQYTIHHFYHNQINTYNCIIPTHASYDGPFPFKYLDVYKKK